MRLYIEANFPYADWMRDCLSPINAPRVWGYHFIADNIKWYDSYESIQVYKEFVRNFIGFAESKEGVDGKQLTWAYEFVRLGEDANDIEEERSENADGILFISREIQLMP
jgi:hypothetical protein